MTALRRFFAVGKWMALVVSFAHGAVAADPIFEAMRLERSPQNHLLIRAFINGKPAVLGVDTGAPVSGIAIERAKHFGVLPIGVDSKIPARININGLFNNLVIARSLRIGALELQDEPLVAIDLGNSKTKRRAGDEPNLDGILGADILFPTKAVLDCDRQILVLKMDPRVLAKAPGYDYRSFHNVPIHVSDGFNLYVDGSVNGRKAQLMVDTGAFATLFHSRLIRELKIPTHKTRFLSSGVNLKERDVSVATISRLTVGSMDMRRKDVGVMNLQALLREGLDAKPPVAGLLGSEILHRYHGIIDFGTNTLYLRD